MIMKKYEKPVTMEVALDQSICEGHMCGKGDDYSTSTKSGKWTVCVHFPERTGKGTTSSPYNYHYSAFGYCKVFEITGRHGLSFRQNPNVDCTWKGNQNAKYYGCGWQNYDTDNNGDCHYFGYVSIDGTQITKSYGGNGTSIKLLRTSGSADDAYDI